MTESGSNSEIGFPIRDAGFGAGDRGHGVGTDRHALRDSRAGGGGASAGGADSGGSRTGGGRAWTAGVDRAAVLQPADSGRKNYVATAAAGDQGATRMAGASRAEPGADASGDSGCHGRERTCSGVEYPAARAGRGFDGAGR